MKYAVFIAALLAVVPLALAQPAVELSLGNGVVYLDVDPNTPANIFAFVLPGATDFAKGPDLPNPAEWTLVEFNGSCHLFSFTQTVYAGTILTVSGCPVTWNNATYVQSWGMGNDWLQDRPDLYGSLACPTVNYVAGEPQYAGNDVTLPVYLTFPDKFAYFGQFTIDYDSTKVAYSIVDVVGNGVELSLVNNSKSLEPEQGNRAVLIQWVKKLGSDGMGESGILANVTFTKVGCGPATLHFHDGGPQSNAFCHALTDDGAGHHTYWASPVGNMVTTDGQATFVCKPTPDATWSGVKGLYR